MKNYYRVMLGKSSAFADQCFAGSFIGVDFGIDQDLTGKLPEDWRTFNHEFIPIFLESHPGKKKIAAGLACGSLWTVAKGIVDGDMVLSPDGTGGYRVGEVAGRYLYRPGENLPHRRPVRWAPEAIRAEEVTEALRRAGSAGTVSNISKHGAEIEKLVAGQSQPSLVASDESVEDPAVFALEKHLEDFLVANWAQTDFGKGFDIYAEEGELVGQQYPSDTGPIDILAISKDKKELLIIELKKGRATDVVVGQLQRYMGYVLQELAETDQRVRGVVIALEDDIKMRRALAVTQNIEFYRYQVSFKLKRA